MIFYIETFVKLLLGLLMATGIIKVTGKTTLAPQSPIDQIQNYILGGIIGGTIYSQDISILKFVFVMLIWAAISLSFYYLRKEFPKLSELLDGKEIRILEQGKIQKKGLKEANLSINQLYAMLRSKGVSSITQVEIGTIEKNGNLSIILKEATSNSYLVISDGELNGEEMKRAEITEHMLIELLAKKEEVVIENIALLELGDNLVINAYQKED
ncbi:DUF421 domain-containing protein [Enterococcus faecalis]|uniref:DUF421 domain-containing protein n=1 Tax=Enterococcus faecalis TaxID=1351 RepID=UPI000352B5C7|nr:YetF domain-containing protein [Enterococcus faecalis]EPI38514.1 hypothetical protein D348_00121 [Enterococcus faecalis SLO2C-1]MCH1672740.1 DUF421 domain-containing protein [Enterococcus faecalis]MDM3980272.1 DUF421 domain-containing protein [Enterococcus faecalis]NSN40917.1 DUF421 domain-containing protein [Enterococcus faecalis]